MKVKSGKLQVGDVKVWKDGEKDVLETQDEVDTENSLMSRMHTPPQPYLDNGDVIGWLLTGPTNVKCIKRKKQPKEIELGPDDVMEKGDIVRWDDGFKIIIDRIRNCSSGGKVYRPVKLSIKNPWKETGKIIDEFEKAKTIFQFSGSPKGYHGCLRKKSENKNIYSTHDGQEYNKTFHEMVKALYDVAKENGWL